MTKNKKDAVIVHGMFSSAICMRPFARSLEKRGIYNRILLIDIKKPSHRQVPRVYAEANAKELAKKLDRKITSKSLSKEFDIFGHSNGGYVALFVNEYLQKGAIDFTFTIASPKGLPAISDIAISRQHKKRVIHFRGGVDGVPFGGEHNPGEGRCVITFPDEGHSSIHLGADNNGLADLIAWINGKSIPDLFVQNGVIHLWPFCREEHGAKESASIRIGTLGECSVCNGMHDFKLETLKAEREVWEPFVRNIPGPASVPLYGGYRILRYFAIRDRLTQMQREAKSNLAYARLQGKQLKEELSALNSANQALEKRISDIDKRLEIFFSAARKRHKERLGGALHPLARARAYSMAIESIGNAELVNITNLLRESERGFLSYFSFEKTKSIGTGG